MYLINILFTILRFHDTSLTTADLTFQTNYVQLRKVDRQIFRLELREMLGRASCLGYIWFRTDSCMAPIPWERRCYWPGRSRRQWTRVRPQSRRWSRRCGGASGAGAAGRQGRRRARRRDSRSQWLKNKVLYLGCKYISLLASLGQNKREKKM